MKLKSIATILMAGSLAACGTSNVEDPSSETSSQQQPPPPPPPVATLLGQTVIGGAVISEITPASDDTKTCLVISKDTPNSGGGVSTSITCFDKKAPAAPAPK